MANQPVGSLRTKEYDLLRALLRQAREAAGISQEALSLQLGRPLTYIGKIEMGTRRLDVVELIEIGLAVQMDLAKLLQLLIEEKQKP